ncbi:hypothetical protein OESDEN_22419 [Oesophagostomum dentatum]|uniref:Uncharacterized protein n=1 Tax=Oesophagostomum dentatum TaxID=61180 RepID=A0A0B1S251_OESDE|nr:hypothetical protein OESDEN_22419 [Oesophagostomum dentatum]
MTRRYATLCYHCFVDYHVFGTTGIYEQRNETFSVTRRTLHLFFEQKKSQSKLDSLGHRSDVVMGRILHFSGDFAEDWSKNP